MKHKQTKYVAKPVDTKGYATYTDEEHAIWHALFVRQLPIVKGRACDEFLHGLDLLNLSPDKIPQCPDVSAVLQEATGWALEPVPALIPFDKFFHLLATRRFPAATFIRTREEMNYLQEPDIFHEVFGHCPLLTNRAYADFTQMYGKLGLSASPADRVLLARLYWFTIEFGLIKTENGLRIYGGGILSSKEETIYSLESSIPQRKPFDPLDALRTPYRIDIKQPIYFILEEMDALYRLLDINLNALIQTARTMGEHPPAYPIKN